MYIYASNWVIIFYAYHHVVQEEEDVHVHIGRDQWDRRGMDWLCDRLSRINYSHGPILMLLGISGHMLMLLEFSFVCLAY